MSRSKVDRAALVDAATRGIRYLVRRREARYLGALTECAGWIYNFQCPTPIRETGDVLIAIAPVLPLEHLEDLAHGAVFYEHMCRGESYAVADKLADDAIRAAGCDVDARNAQMECDAPHVEQQAVH